MSGASHPILLAGTSSADLVTRRGLASEVQTPFGLFAGRLVTPPEVARGLACGCICPGCGAALVARKGHWRAWSFAHHGGKGSLACVESAVHAAAKQLLRESLAVAVPAMSVRVAKKTTGGTWHSRERVLGAERMVRFDRCDIEVPMGSVRADFVGYRGGRQMVVEIFVTHRVDTDKANMLEALGIPVLEIDLSDMPRRPDGVDFEELRQRVVDGASHKRWLHYPGAADCREELLRALSAEVAVLDQRAQLRAERAMERQARSDASYLALPLEEKERRLRRALSIDGDWPEHLDQERFNASALGQPTYIWQGLIFAQFVAPRPRGGPFTVEEVAEWITARLGISAEHKDPSSAIRGYLAFLCARHYLTRGRSGDQVSYMRVQKTMPAAHDCDHTRSRSGLPR